MSETQEYIGAEAKETGQDALDGYVKLYGELLQEPQGLDYANGRKLFILRFKSVWVFRMFNPKNVENGDWKTTGVQIVLSREALQGITLLTSLIEFGDESNVETNRIFIDSLAEGEDKELMKEITSVEFWKKAREGEGNAEKSVSSVD